MGWGMEMSTREQEFKDGNEHQGALLFSVDRGAMAALTSSL